MSQAQVEKMTTVCADECCAPPALILLPKSSDREALVWNCGNLSLRC